MVSAVENFLFELMDGYDKYVYSPLQDILSPRIALIPRYWNLQNGKRIAWFTANTVTFARTFLIFPIAWFLKFDQCFLAALMVVLHDFLDHLDGIVAKVHKRTYPNADDPLLGGFLDAFCDKIVNVISLWTIIQMKPFENGTGMFLYLIICYTVIAYEVIIGIIRVDDYYAAKYKELNAKSDVDADFENVQSSENENLKAQNLATQSSMEGKLKEKLESMGIAFLCLALSKVTYSFINKINTLFALTCLALTIRMAHKSLTLKINARKAREQEAY